MKPRMMVDISVDSGGLLTIGSFLLKSLLAASVYRSCTYDI